MKKILYIILISIFSFTIFSCSEDKEESTTDTTAPVIAEVTAVTTPTNDSTPDYTFSSDEAGTITYGGSCSSSTTSAISGNNTITFTSLSGGPYSNCTIIVKDSAGNASNILATTSFVVIPYFVAVGNSETILTSSGGTTWTTVTGKYDNGTILSGTFGDIAYGNSVYVMTVGSNGDIFTSTDATTWTSRTSGTSNTLNGVNYGNSKFVAVGNSGTILTSSGGTTWTTVTGKYDNGTILSGTFGDIAYGNSVYVMTVDSNGDIFTSTDATTWTSRTSGTSNTLNGVNYTE